MRTATILCAALAGCATYTPQQLQQAAAGAPSWQLCYTVISGRGDSDIQSAAIRELQRRGSNCQAEMPMVMAKLQADAQRNAAAAAMYQQMQRNNQAYQQYMQSLFRQQTCNTTFIGNTAQTTCR